LILCSTDCTALYCTVVASDSVGRAVGARRTSLSSELSPCPMEGMSKVTVESEHEYCCRILVRTVRVVGGLVLVGEEDLVVSTAAARNWLQKVSLIASRIERSTAPAKLECDLLLIDWMNKGSQILLMKKW